ncbi:hypothetical protein BDU57DRAFT_513516 [Ampelomyces quisqualis]|uniref:Uncharacterized protein n=1 Tax=Ampelomyces quisqualis TaxID=50730 RepID=A0A6A5QPJ0_AMPQU|nr:hypothetical protein BDU57DRAFT_513516 [Ampelomyces quisqualis]
MYLRSGADVTATALFSAYRRVRLLCNGQLPFLSVCSGGRVAVTGACPTGQAIRPLDGRRPERDAITNSASAEDFLTGSGKRRRLGSFQCV